MAEGPRHPRAAWVLLAAVLLGAVGWGSWALAQRVAFVQYPEDEVASIRYVHAYRGRPVCQACHPGRDQTLAAHPTRLCTRCHAALHDSHPYDIPQPQPERCRLPLHDGTITCHTCHDPHDTQSRRAGLWLPFNELCQRCHPGH